MTGYVAIGLICNALGPKKPLICKAFRGWLDRGLIHSLSSAPEGPQKARRGDFTKEFFPMAENRRFYYLKLKENFYNSETMVVLESMPDGLLYSNLLLKMYLMSLKSGGILLLGDHFPHTPQTIATCTRHQIGTVERGLKIFLQLGLIEILTDGAYYMTDIQLLIGQSSTEGERKKRERSRLQRQSCCPLVEWTFVHPMAGWTNVRLY